MAGARQQRLAPAACSLQLTLSHLHRALQLPADTRRQGGHAALLCHSRHEWISDLNTYREVASLGNQNQLPKPQQSDKTEHRFLTTLRSYTRSAPRFCLSRSAVKHWLAHQVPCDETNCLTPVPCLLRFYFELDWGVYIAQSYIRVSVKYLGIDVDYPERSLSGLR